MEATPPLDLVFWRQSVALESELATSNTTAGHVHNHRQQLHLLNLPDEIVLRILSFVPSPSRTILAQTCHHFRDGRGYEPLHSAWSRHETLIFMCSLLRTNPIPLKHVCMYCIRIRPEIDFQNDSAIYQRVHTCITPLWIFPSKTKSLPVCLRHARFWITSNEFLTNREIKHILRKRHHTIGIMSGLAPLQIQHRILCYGEDVEGQEAKIETCITLGRARMPPKSAGFVENWRFRRAVARYIEMGGMFELLEKADIFLCTHLSLNDLQVISACEDSGLATNIFLKRRARESLSWCHECLKEGARTEFGLRLEKSGDDLLWFRLILVRGIVRDNLSSSRGLAHRSANWRCHVSHPSSLNLI